MRKETACDTEVEIISDNDQVSANFIDLSISPKISVEIPKKKAIDDLFSLNNDNNGSQNTSLSQSEDITNQEFSKKNLFINLEKIQSEENSNNNQNQNDSIQVSHDQSPL